MIESSEIVPIQTAKVPVPLGPYSQAVAVGNFIFCSGQIPLECGASQIFNHDATTQAEVVLRHLGSVLEAAGSSFDAVIKTTVFLTDMQDFAAVNAVYEKFFGTAKPARSTVAVFALPKDARVEIEAIALRA